MRALICGAGVAGLALAVRLSELPGWEVLLLQGEPGPPGGDDLIDFHGPGHDAADAMGLLPRLRELGRPVTGTALIDARDGGRDTGARRFPRRSQDGRRLRVLTSDLQLALGERLPASVARLSGVGPERIDAHRYGVRLRLTDGGGIGADLLVGADGTHSAVRTLAFGPGHRHVRDPGLRSMASAVHDPEPHHRGDGMRARADGPGQQIGPHPLRDGRVAVSAVHRADGTAPPDGNWAALRRAFGATRLLVPPAGHGRPPSLRLRHHPVTQTELPSWSQGRITLVGGACHAVSPLRGQDALLDLAGARVLADQLAGARSVEAALASYERLWRPVVARQQRAARAAARRSLPATRRQARLGRIVLRTGSLLGPVRPAAASPRDGFRTVRRADDAPSARTG
ncbi:FAD-dependent monooxygenase [Streptomyces sp. ACT015]|uniref:FAD-dependent monooxygenase n=1 Tax=Streptomyces sp. ACT015 TaxID=3134807 RepID=UPI003D182AD3